MIKNGWANISAHQEHRKLAARCKRKFHLDAHIPPDEPMLGDEFAAQEFVREILGTGADSVCVFSKCHYGYSYYPTELGHPHPGLKIDLLGALTREFKRQAPQVPVLVYYNMRFSPIDSKVHGEWAITQPADASKEIEAGHLSSMWRKMCFNTPYGEAVRGQFEEIVRRYPIDGFFIDFSRSSGTCHCRWCRAKYLKETGREIPLTTEGSEFAAYAAWQRNDSDRFVNDLAADMRKIRPEISVGSNYCYGIRQPLPPDGAIGYLCEDVLERNNAPGFNESLDGRYYCSLDIPAEIMTTRMSNWWTDWGFKNDDQLFLQNAVILALGLNIDLSDELYPTYRIPARVLSLFRRVFKRAEKIQEIMDGAVSAPDTLILHTAASYYRVPRAANDSEEMISSLRGMHSVLQQSEFHHQIVNESVLPRWLGKAKALILPDQAEIDEDTIGLIKKFVRAGGNLMGFGDTLRIKALEEVFGVAVENEFDGKPDKGRCDNPEPGVTLAGGVGCPHQFLLAKPFIDYEGEDFPVMVCGATFKLRLMGARMISALQEGLFSIEGFCHGHPIGPVRYPGITENRYGRGRAIAIAASVGKSMDKRPYPELKRLMLGVMRSLLADSFVSGKSLDNVEITHFSKGKTEIVHVINHPLKPYSKSAYAIEKINKIRNFEIQFRLSAKPVMVYVEERDAIPEWAWADGILTVRLDELHIHKVIIIETA